MRSRWSDDEAQAFLDRYAARWGEALALRVYTSRLIGAEASLVMHGGGNTSVKGRAPDVFGEPVDVVFVKGSGWDLATIEPEGLPAVRLHHLRRMCRLPALSDETMVNEQRTHLLDASAPNPSIEALLHAFLPATFVDHSHADAILLLTNRAGGEAHVRAALGEGVLLVPYVKPGFDLAAVCARLLDDNPGCTSMVLMQHGLFTWGETARESYERHIELVSRAEAYVAARPALPAALATDDAVAVAR
ncbi:MAG TPA: class II aldolase/adducin family protein, partial [Myxococcota bacterium]|nr:class II aldolase/adducin family protein [Myxococcota bacterium]